MVDETPRTRYARNGDYSVAYQVVGDGDVDLVYLPGFASHLEVFWEQPEYSRFLRRLASFSRLILIDRLGTGLSDRLPPGRASTVDERMDDIREVMDAVGSERAALLGWSEGTMPCVTFAATHPDRTSALVIYGGMPRVIRTEAYPIGPTAEVYDKWVTALSGLWGESEEILRYWAPSAADDPDARAWFLRYNRLAASPGAVADLWQALRETDVRDVLPTITVPTLVIHRSEDTLVPVEHGRFMAEHFP
jgi:pimeloyl-ACP methyl ester carboxylesterase